MSPTTAPISLAHLGGPSVVLDYAGLRIVSDPTFDPAGSTYKVLGLLPISKTTDTAVTAAQLGDVHAVLVSHNTHADNLDVGGRELVRSVVAQGGAVITNPAAAKDLAGSRGLATWESTEIASPTGVTVTITATPARHAHGPVAWIAGPVTGFMLEAPGLPTVYISGDNISRKATARVAERYRPSIAVMHAGLPRFTASGPVPFCMTAVQVADAVVALGSPRTLVVHSDGWSHFTESEADVARAFSAPALAGVRIDAPQGQAVEVLV